MTRLWTDAELRQLRAMARKKASAAEIARSIQRHVGSVRAKARELGLVLIKTPKTQITQPVLGLKAKGMREDAS
jgi:hypothetical protein